MSTEDTAWIVIWVAFGFIAAGLTSGYFVRKWAIFIARDAVRAEMEKVRVEREEVSTSEPRTTGPVPVGLIYTGPNRPEYMTRQNHGDVWVPTYDGQAEQWIWNDDFDSGVWTLVEEKDLPDLLPKLSRQPRPSALELGVPRELEDGYTISVVYQKDAAPDMKYQWSIYNRARKSGAPIAISRDSVIGLDMPYMLGNSPNAKRAYQEAFQWILTYGEYEWAIYVEPTR